MSQERAIDKLKNIGPVGLLLGIVGGILCAAGGLSEASRPEFFKSYLFAYIFWVAATLGLFALSLLHHTVRGKWGLPTLRIMEAGGGPASILLMLILFAPIGLGMHDLYHWTHADAVATDHVLRSKEAYLNVPFFLIRLGFYFLCWLIWATRLRNSSVKQHVADDKKALSFRTNLASPGLVMIVLTVTFAFTDWVMSTDAHWYSTIFGFWFVAGMGLTALAIITLVVTANHKKTPYAQVVNPVLTKDLGNLMLAFTMLWAYTSLSQFLITWSGNLPEFIGYYSVRSNNDYQFLGAVNVVCGFFVSFIWLLSPKVKATPSRLMMVAIWILLIRVLDMYWIVLPALRPGALTVHWMDLAAFVAVGGFWLFVFGTQLKKAPLLPQHDSRMMEAFDHVA